MELIMFLELPTFKFPYLVSLPPASSPWQLWSQIYLQFIFITVTLSSWIWCLVLLIWYWTLIYLTPLSLLAVELGVIFVSVYSWFYPLPPFWLCSFCRNINNSKRSHSVTQSQRQDKRLKRLLRMKRKGHMPEGMCSTTLGNKSREG